MSTSPLPLTTLYAIQLAEHERAEIARVFALLPLAEQARSRWKAEECARRHSYAGGVCTDEKRGFDFDPSTGGWTR